MSISLVGLALLAVSPVAPSSRSAAPVAAPLVGLQGEITLPELIDLLETRSPAYKAVLHQVDGAKARITAAKVLPNPTIGLSLLYLNQGFNQNGVATYFATVSLPVLIAGQRRWRVRTAKAGVDAVAADVHVQHQAYVHIACALFVSQQAAQERIQVLNAALAEIAALDARQPNAGNLYSVRVNFEVSRLRARLAETETSVHDMAGRLGVLLGLPELSAHAVGPLTQLGISGTPGLLWNEFKNTHPAVEAARRTELYTLKRVDLARRERWPTPSVSVGTVAIQNYYSISTFVGLSVPVPMFDWGQGQIAGASADNQRATLETKSVELESEAQLHRLFRRLEHRRRALQTFEADVLVTVPAMQRLAGEAAQGGRPEVAIDITMTLFNVKLSHIDKIEALVRAELDVLAAAGRIETAVNQPPSASSPAHSKIVDE